MNVDTIDKHLKYATKADIKKIMGVDNFYQFQLAVEKSEGKTPRYLF